MRIGIYVNTYLLIDPSSSNTPSTNSNTSDLFLRITRNRHVWKEFNLYVIVDKEYDEEFQELIR